MKLVRPISLGGGTNFFKNLRKFLASLLSTKSHVLNPHTHIKHRFPIKVIHPLIPCTLAGPTYSSFIDLKAHS